MNTAQEPPAAAADDGAAVYSPFLLRYIYDFWVLWVSNNYAWLCPTRAVQLPLYSASMGAAHLDIGVGTGYYPAKSLESGSSRCTDLTLLDLNPNSLDATADRVRKASKTVNITKVVASALEPLPLEEGKKFDSVSVFFLLHCLPGPPEGKTKLFDVVRPHVAEDGVLVGTTVLGRERPINWFGKKLMDNYNNKLKSFDNWEDNQKCFDDGLHRNFEEVESWVVGQVMLFRAKKPRTQPAV